METRENRDKTRDEHEKDPEIGSVYFHEIGVLIGNVYFVSGLSKLVRQLLFVTPPHTPHDSSVETCQLVALLSFHSRLHLICLNPELM